jgi:cell division protein FtsB
MREVRLAFVMMAAVVAMSGCDSIHNLTGASREIQQQKAEITQLKNSLAKLQAEVKKLQTEQANLVVDSWFRKAGSVAYLTPGDSGYSVVNSNIGKLTIQMSNIQPYANGSKITLKFGNPLAADIEGIKVKLQWGSVDEKGLPIKGSEKSQEFSFVQTLSSGAWTSIPVVLAGIEPSKLGYVRVEDVSHTGISLRRR